MCPSFSVYSMLHWCNISRILIKSVTHPAAGGFVRCPPITCPLPPYGKLGLFLPLLVRHQTRPSQDASRCGANFYLNVSLIDQSLDLKTPQIAINRVLVKNMCELNHHCTSTTLSSVDFVQCTHVPYSKYIFWLQNIVLFLWEGELLV